LLSPDIVDQETAHDRAERQAVGMRPRAYARFDVSISSMKEKSALSAGRINRRRFFGWPSSAM